MIRYGKHAKVLLVAAGMVGVAGCLGPGGVLGSDQDEDLVFRGTIAVTAVTTGAAPDTDGYLASLDESLVQPIEPNGSVAFEGVSAGTYGVRLDGYAANCSVTTANPVFVTVLPDSTVPANFAVDCP